MMRIVESTKSTMLGKAGIRAAPAVRISWSPPSPEAPTSIKGERHIQLGLGLAEQQHSTSCVHTHRRQPSKSFKSTASSSPNPGIVIASNIGKKRSHKRNDKAKVANSANCDAAWKLSTQNRTSNTESANRSLSASVDSRLCRQLRRKSENIRGHHGCNSDGAKSKQHTHRIREAKRNRNLSFLPVQICVKLPN